MMNHIIAIDPNGTGLQGIRNLKGNRQALCVDGSNQAVGGVVCHLKSFFLIFGLGDGADRSKVFLLYDLHIRSYI